MKGMDNMHIGTKGWYVAELKKLGITKIEGRKLETYKSYVLAAELRRVQGN
jgi:uncharacterized protein YecE (DUF72 family)